MPIRPDLRPFYRGPGWRATRERILARGENHCEQCGKPNGETVWTLTGVVVLAPDDRRPWMFWTPDVETAAARGTAWFDQFGQRRELRPTMLSPSSTPRVIRVKIGVAHLDHDPSNNADENLRALCDWCHLHYDKLHHRETRATRKDRSRPIQWEGGITV